MTITRTTRGAPGTGRSPRRVDSMDRKTVLVTFLLMPATFFQGAIGGFRPTGLAWVVVLATGLLALLLRPVSPRAGRYVTPYAAYVVFGAVSLAWAPNLASGIQTLAQLTTVAVVYLVAWRAMGDDPRLILRLRRLATWLLPSAMLLFGQTLLTTGGLNTAGARPAAMSIALLFLLATHERSARFTFALGGLALAFNLVAGSRMGTLIMVLLIVLSPSIAFSWRTRLALAVAGFAIFAALVPTAAFQERWFVGRNPGTISDIIFLEDNFNTAGRGENWPLVFERCNERPYLGFGLGAGSHITNEVNPKSNHPHNEYLRSYCDGGVLAASSFWLFFVLVGVRAVVQRGGRQRSRVPNIAALLVLTILLFAATDNITIYTIQFMAPAAVLFAASDRLFATSRLELLSASQRR